MGVLLIWLGVMTNQLESMIVKRYGERYGKGGMFFNAIMCLFATVYFFVTDTGGLHFPKEIVIFGVINSFMYGLGFYSGYAAYKSGSFGLTRLFTSFGVIVPAFYGIIYLGEKASVFTFVAFALIIGSLYLINYRKEGNGQKISFNWIVWVLLVVFSNAAITIIGKLQYDMCGDAYKNEFLILSLSLATVMLFVLGLIFERQSFKPVMKQGMLYGASAGVCNGIYSVLMLVAYNYLPISVTSPLKSGFGIVVSFLLSVFLYKEKLSVRQIIGAVAGGAAVVIMNL